MGSKAGKEFGNKLETLDIHTGLLRAELQTLAGVGAQSLTTGTHFDALQVLGDNLGSVIGNAVVSGMVSPHYLDEYNETMNELSIDGLLSDYQETKQKLNDYRESPQLVEEERNVTEHSSEGYNGEYCAIPVEDNNYSPIPDGFYDKAQQTQLREAAGKIMAMKF
ncbi:hypothetical protein J2N86_13765 [Legionella lytica]|uniref:LXG domain-containing protein n=1 Tax=Legionella lytica TaxID=96232 RepID=A0ABY4Y7X9_9GAMM|nr:hypothetical protein [Legionella lytica]USQ13722.1 hypothetical protein J2N86_13765 [Legionella lytica]